jgi:hypothetical protein
MTEKEKIRPELMRMPLTYGAVLFVAWALMPFAAPRIMWVLVAGLMVGFTALAFLQVGLVITPDALIFQGILGRKASFSRSSLSAIRRGRGLLELVLADGNVRSVPALWSPERVRLLAETIGVQYVHLREQSATPKG